MEYQINAEGKVLGRLATEVAVLLRGKNDPVFDPAIPGKNRVVVYNTDAVRLTGRKLAQKKYRRHSGYPGGLREETLERMMKRDSREALRHAVRGMLPKNRLRAQVIKNMILHKGPLGLR